MRSATGCHDAAAPRRDLDHDDLSCIDPGRIMISDVKRAVCSITGVPPWFMTSASKGGDGGSTWMRARQIAMALSVELTGRSLPYVGQHFGGRDHTTVMHAKRRIEDLCKTDGGLLAIVESVRQILLTAAERGEASQVVPRPRTVHTYRDGRVSILGTIIKVDGDSLTLTAGQVHLLDMLFRSYGRVVTPADAGLSPGGMSNCVSKLRRRLAMAALPIEIHASTTSGYLVVMAGEVPSVGVIQPRARPVMVEIDHPDPRIADLRRRGFSVTAISRQTGIAAPTVARALGIMWGGIE